MWTILLWKSSSLEFRGAVWKNQREIWRATSPSICGYLAKWDISWSCGKIPSPATWLWLRNNGPALILFQNIHLEEREIVMTNHDKVYHKLRELFHYKSRQRCTTNRDNVFVANQDGFFIANHDKFITDYDSYCKSRRSSQITTGGVFSS